MDDGVLCEWEVDVVLGKDLSGGGVNFSHVLAKVAFPSCRCPPQFVLNDAVGKAGGARVEACCDTK